MQPKILLVDDEPQVTAALTRALRHEAYDVLTANSALEALRVLQQVPVDVIVSDEQMPGMVGSELLAIVRRDYPETARIIWDRVALETGTVRLYQDTTKNEDGRVLALPTILKAILDQQWQEHLVYYLECPFVFHNQSERTLTFYKTRQRACKEAGISVQRLVHDFHCTAVRNLCTSGRAGTGGKGNYRA